MSRNRPLWWTELPLLAAVYAAYSAGRLLARGDVSTAVGNGLAILRFEEWLWLDVERPLNRLFTDNAWLGIPADFFYATLHYLVTPALLVWIFRRRSAHYRRMRTWLLVSTLVGLVGFTLLPTCPPRLLAAGYGFVDTMAQYGHYGWWGGEASAPRGLGGLTNQYAAMPSLHVGWSLWCGVVLWQLAGRRGWVRAAAVAYPLLTTVVVMGTANHYLLDAVAGAAVMGLGLLLTRPATRFAERLAGRLRRYAPAGPAGGAVAAPEGPASAPVPAGAAGARSVSRPSGGPSRRTAGAVPVFGDLNSPAVTTGCHTSPGERHPRQPTDDSPAPAAR
ncbi:phosphatase PAP2 family protein [Streptomyces sp. TRM 70361]|uniref:phosphatase PAP2 family protein n=1 Tax=Streptomyces sp. TRM 70361 TaxID=3116553 RepID=UPI002E7C4153|nr:phosphatase PAP2 family protein [Streptomyces sp. TRM 70361]MEE1937943.1 phosphatase PAP2 family protein [Streptomyces sp. TRM 70361]